MTSTAVSPGRTAALTAAALVAFAANSLLCRAALASSAVDAATFTFVRMVSGAAMLALVVRLRSRAAGATASLRDRVAPAALVAYAITFSFAYLRLTAATGALILFGMVQLTMLGWAIRGGERPRPLAWLGIVAAISGLFSLLVPGLTAPDPLGAALMALAGAAWGVYTLRGRGSPDPLAATARNFARGAPLAGVAFALAAASGRVWGEPRGVLFAVASGALASGLGYAIWYAALRGLTATRAAILQLAVPVLAAASGVLVLGEPLTPRVVVSGAVILGGIATVVLGR